MVIYYKCSTPGYIIFAGEDKYENEELIKYGWPEDVWFHVSAFSSPHVYVRRPSYDISLEDLPPDVVNECAVISWKGSIKGWPKDQVSIVYTQWENLHKTTKMEVGQVGFHDQKKVSTINLKKTRTIEDTYKLLKKTIEISKPNLQEQREVRDKEEKERKKKEKKKQASEDRKRYEEEQKIKQERSYDKLWSTSQSESKETNTLTVEEYEDGFL